MKKQWKELTFLFANVLLMMIIKYVHGDYGFIMADPFASNILDIVSCLMLFSVGYILLLLKRIRNGNNKTILICVGIILFLISTAMLIWLPLHKELFHWNYDVTGKPVDHYSTYGSCVVFTVIAIAYIVIGLVSSIITSITCLKKECLVRTE